MYGRRPSRQAGTCVPGQHHTPVQGSELGAVVEAGGLTRRPARLSHGKALPSSPPLSPAHLPRGEITHANSGQTAWAPVPALPLTSCVTLEKLHNHFLLPFAHV